MKFEYVYDKKLACLDNIIKFISEIENIEYRLFFSGSWKFKYVINRKNLGNSLKVDYENNFTMLRDISGLESKKIYKICKNRNLEKLLQKYNYFIVFVDSFYCYWNKDYQKKHSNSDLILINQIDIQNQVVYITDLQYQLFNYAISLENYQKAALSGIVLKHYTNTYQITKNDIITILFKKIIQKQKHIRHLQRFKNGLHKSNIKFELNCTGNPWDTMLIKQIGRLIIDRYRYILFLYYVKENFDFNTDETITLLELSIENWSIFQNSLIKQMTSRITDNNGNCKKVNKIIEIEENVFKSLFIVLGVL